ncbi:NAD(FAD)-utilizing dehydrogenase [Roseobacter cerasinus]|uniref:NAD(FAD)-utilizing dehydrogenase n=1 Tax=Roseobacter cerasinus TaxID=2602289 RepID=A0A640VNF6_9RHOB|nr:TIGR03862 family flavoprotein [Roseobacter cerasinus]GFE49192.1 NAD(FAD)-utilizing dehydrogenase [Roseobacter cerasinus]
MTHALVIGAGPAGLMAAEELAAAGVRVTVCEAKPSVGRKFLMAGKSGLNLAKDEPLQEMLPRYVEAAEPLRPMLEAFDAQAVQDWARGLGQEVFTGSTGRVFPKAMKASPLLRAWLGRLDAAGVRLRTNMRWQGWQDGHAVFDGPQGAEVIAADVTVLALGGASWARLGADGLWASSLQADGIALSHFAPANVGLKIGWSSHMRKHTGVALKGVRFTAGPLSSRGEAVVSRTGLEGGGVYEVSRAVRLGQTLLVDLLPDLDMAEVEQRLGRAPAKASLSNRLRKALRLDPVKIALAQECARPLPQAPDDLARVLKGLEIRHDGLCPMDQAISVAGGVRFDALTEDLMLKARPGVFCAGEMIDWEAPTGGYLITACIATGRWAGRGAAAYLLEAA